jgi:hypothetical protein
MYELWQSGPDINTVNITDERNRTIELYDADRSVLLWEQIERG